MSFNLCVTVITVAMPSPRLYGVCLLRLFQVMMTTQTETLFQSWWLNCLGEVIPLAKYHGLCTFPVMHVNLCQSRQSQICADGTISS